jgi:hypothetical protein
MFFLSVGIVFDATLASPPSLGRFFDCRFFDGQKKNNLSPHF